MNAIVKYYADKTTLYYPNRTDTTDTADTFDDIETGLLPHDWVDQQLELNYHSYADNDFTFDGIIDHHYYYSTNDDYDFYFLYDTTPPISLNTLSNITRGFSTTTTTPDIDNHLLDIVNYRKNRRRGDDVSYYSNLPISIMTNETCNGSDTIITSKLFNKYFPTF